MRASRGLAAGKTGTAVLPTGRHTLFAGWVPHAGGATVILVDVAFEGAADGRFGGNVAAPAFAEPGSHFYHVVVTQRREAYTETERYPCGTQTTGYGSTSRSTTRYCTRMVTKYRTVYDRRTITDGECEQQGHLLAAPGDIYVLQYDYYMGGRCSLRCMQQRPGPNGTFQLVLCPAR